MRRVNEDPEQAVLTLLALLENPGLIKFKAPLTADLLYKLRPCRESFRLYAYERLVAIQHPQFMLPISSPEPRKCLDVVFVTVIPNELLAAKIALGLSPEGREDDASAGMRFWHTTITGTDGLELRVAVTMIGEARNVPAAAAMSRLFLTYEVRTCLLTGIAGGVRGKVKLGDVVASHPFVLDYEGERREADGPLRRPYPQPLQQTIKRDLEYFSPRALWNAEFKKCLSALEQFSRIPDEARVFTPEYKPGVILTGEALFADGSLPKMREDYHEQVKAVEMEASGFARVCNEFSVPWLIFRGISDYGEPDKDSVWQTTAALSAVTCSIDFVKRDLRLERRNSF